ncbi:MAG: hypothetical protein OXN19_07005 [Caldilineaceae bacterium]|nr:hypothetical protein [Caldilineaceae bacterium]
MSLRRTAGAAFCLVILMVAACDSGSPGAAAGDPDNGLVSVTPSDATDRGPERGEVVIGDPDESGPYASDPYTMAATGGDDGPVIEGDTLTITLSFSGGCAPHDFTLITAPAFMESDPVILDLFLTHDDHGDSCEAYPTEHHAFDLTPVRALYREAYAEDAGIVLLRIRDGEMNLLDEIAYEFGGTAVNGE